MIRADANGFAFNIRRSVPSKIPKREHDRRDNGNKSDKLYFVQYSAAKKGETRGASENSVQESFNILFKSGRLRIRSRKVSEYDIFPFYCTEFHGQHRELRRSV